MDDDERATVPGLERERRLHAVQDAHRRRGVQLLGAVEPRPVRRDPPGAGVIRQRELGQLVGDGELAEAGLFGELVAETHAVVEHPEHHGEPPAWRCRFDDGHAELVVMVADARHLAPRLGPGLVHRRAGRVGQSQAVAQRRRPPELEAQSGRQEHGPPVPLHAIEELALTDLDGHLVAAVGGSDPDLCLPAAGNAGDPEEQGDLQHVCLQSR